MRRSKRGVRRAALGHEHSEAVCGYCGRPEGSSWRATTSERGREKITCSSGGSPQPSAACARLAQSALLATNYRARLLPFGDGASPGGNLGGPKQGSGGPPTGNLVPGGSQMWLRLWKDGCISENWRAFNNILEIEGI